MPSRPLPFARRLPRLCVIVMSGAVVLLSCGDSDPTTSDEYVDIKEQLGAARDDSEALTGELDSMESELEELSTERDGLNEDLGDVQAELIESEDQRERLEEERDSAFEDRDSAVEDREDAIRERDEALEESERLKEQYDPQVRAELQTQVDVEITRACSVAKVDIDAPISDLVRYDDAWKPVAGRKAVVDAIESCAASERAKTADQREQDRLSQCAPIAVDQVEKNPGAYEGTCVVLYANVVQFDAATGPCSFQADIAGSDLADSFDYTARSNFGLTDDELLSALETECPALEQIDVDDFVRIYATGIGAYTYDTNIGGSNTIPSFKIERIELLRKG